MPRARWYGASLLSTLLTALWLSANGFAADTNDVPKAFRSGVDLVTLDVCVRDATGRFLPTLTSDDFLILENGAVQRVSFLTPAAALPLRVILIIDSSASMSGPKLARAREAAAHFTRFLQPEDQLEIISFNQAASVVLSFDDDRSNVAPTLARVFAGGMTALNEALLVAANELRRAQRAHGTDVREVVIVLTDGEDTASVIGFDEVLRTLRGSNALVYTLSLRTNRAGEWLGANWPLLQLAVDTGGRALTVPSLDALPALYREIDTEVRHLYRIGYVSNDPRRDGAWRKLAVRLRSGEGRIQARAGYYASRR